MVTPDRVVLLVALICEIIVCYLAIRRQLWRTLPLFCLYIGWNLISDAFFCWMISTGSNTSPLYYKYYLVETITDSIFMFTVLVELAWSVLRPVRPSLPKGSLVMLIGIMALAAVVIWPLAGFTVPPEVGVHSVRIFRVQETFSILRVLVFLVIASFSQLLSIGWKDRELQIATGLGFYSIVSLLVALNHAHQSADAQYHWVDLAGSISYLGTLFYWLVSFSTKEQERKEFSPQMQQLLVQMGGGARAGRIALGDIPSKISKSKD